MKKTLFALPGNERIAGKISVALDAEIGKTEIRRFPDGESYVRVMSEVKQKDILVVAALDDPDKKILSLYFLCRLLKDLDAGKITLIAPYLAYMRQDKRFKEGEAVTNRYFALLLSSFADEIITIDPHLHRTHSLEEIYSVPCRALHASTLIAEWIRENIKKPLLIGPDSESRQWVSEIAGKVNAPFRVLEKTRLGDDKVHISLPDMENYKDHTPVIADDIISTAGTMMKTVSLLRRNGFAAPVCIGIHALFSKNAYAELRNAGAGKIVTCNTLPHESNEIDVSGLILQAINSRI